MTKTLLVVDDSPDITITIKNMLEEDQGNYKILIAESGEECLKLLKENFTPDAIILDIMLPGIDGLETYERIQKNEKWSKIPVIFLTARTDHFTEGAGRYLGDDFVQKPFEIDDLINRIENAIAKRQEENK